MDIVQIVTKDLNSASESDLEALIAAWARMYRTNGFDIKLVSLNDPNVVVVEKSNMAKFTVKTVTTALRTVANILLVLLAIIGILALIYPETRTGLLEIWKDTIDNLSHLL